MGWKWLALCLAGCFKDDPGPPAPTISMFAFSASNFQLRDGGCATAGILFAGSEDLKVDLTIEGPAQLYETEGGTQQRGFTMCTALGAHGHGKLHATIEGRSDAVDATYDVVVPAETIGLQPISVFGHAFAAPTRVRWSDDGAQIFVTYDSDELRAFSATTLTPTGAWVGIGQHAAVIGGNRAVGDLMFGWVPYDLVGERSLTWLAGPVGGALGFEGDPYNFGQIRGVEGHGDVVAIGEYYENNCAVGLVDLASGTHEVVAGFSFGDITSSGYDPLRVMFQMSADGNSLIYTGVMKCPTVLDKGGTSQVYDRRTKTIINCGPTDTDAKRVSNTGVAFSYDGGVLGWFTNHDATIVKMPECTTIATAHDDFDQYAQLAISPDGTHLAYVTDLGAYNEVRDVDLARQPFVLGGTPQVKIQATPHNDFWTYSRHALAYSPDGKKIAVALLGGGLAIVDIASGTAIQDHQMPLLGSPTDIAIAPDYEHAIYGAMNTYEAIDLGDGHVIATTFEHIVDAKTEGYVIDPGGTMDFALVDWTTGARSTIPRYTIAVDDGTSPTTHRRCTMLGGAVPQLCVLEAGGAHVACMDYPHDKFPALPLSLLMLDEDRCFFEANSHLFQYTASTSQLVDLGRDPANSLDSNGSYLRRGPQLSHELISIGGPIVTWRIPQ